MWLHSPRDPELLAELQNMTQPKKFCTSLQLKNWLTWLLKKLTNMQDSVSPEAWYKPRRNECALWSPHALQVSQASRCWFALVEKWDPWRFFVKKSCLETTLINYANICTLITMKKRYPVINPIISCARFDCSSTLSSNPSTNNIA